MRPLLLVAVALLLAAPAAAQREPVWQTSLDGHPDARGFSIGAKGKRIFVGGRDRVGTAPNRDQAVIAAVAAKTGGTEWVEVGDVGTGGGGASWESFFAPMVLAKRAVVVGGLVEGDTPNDQGVIWVYDQATGTRLWSENIPQTFWGFVAAKGKVAVVGATTGLADPETSALLRGYDLLSGAPLWEEIYDGEGEPVSVSAVGVAGKVVVLVGRIGDFADSRALIRAHDVKTGAFLWEDTYEGTPNALFTAVATQGRRIYVGGRDGDEELMVAYDAKTGGRLWDRTDPSPGSNLVEAIAVKGRRVVALGFQLSVVRAFDARTGVVLWDTDLLENGVGGLGVGRALAAKGRRLLAATDYNVFALDLKDGSIVWRSADFQGAIDVAFAGKLAVAASFGGVNAYLAK